jgi:hypothetical protein
MLSAELGGLMANPTPDAAENELRSDPRFVSGIQKLDRGRLQGLSDQLEKDLRAGIEFYNHLEDAIRAKVRARKQAPQAENALAETGNEAVDALKDAENAAGQATAMLKEAGLDEVVNRHGPAIFKNYDDNANIQAHLARFRDLGARDESLQCIHNEIAKDDFNVLRVRGADGTLDGLTRAMRVEGVQKLVEIIQTQGLPTIMGGGSGGEIAGGVVGTLIVIGGIIIIISWFF